jgi:transposase
MYRTELSAGELSQLQDLQQNHIHPHIRRRSLVLLLRHEHSSNDRITKITGLCENTITHYVQLYKDGGIERLTELHFRTPVSQLQPFDERIKTHFEKNPVATIAQACKEVEELTGIAIKNTQMRFYLKNLGIEWRKVSSIPAKVDIDAQKKFHDEQLQPRLEEAKTGKRAVYFVDAAHFVLGAFLGYLWSLTRIFVRTPSGRQRFNVLGALNAITKELLTITNDSYITSIQVCELLVKIAECSSGIPITLVLDNARYQRCKMVMELAEQLGIELLFLPPYSPNLNLIERLWKLTKKKCLYSKYYSNFKEFSHAISHFLATMNCSHQEELDSLLTLKFQLFTEEQIKKAGDFDKAAPTLSVIESTKKTSPTKMEVHAVPISTCVEAA